MVTHQLDLADWMSFGCHKAWIVIEPYTELALILIPLLPTLLAHRQEEDAACARYRTLSGTAKRHARFGIVLAVSRLLRQYRSVDFPAGSALGLSPTAAGLAAQLPLRACA